MARRSKLQTEIPKEILEEFNAKLVEDGFADYTGMTDWLNDRLAEHGLSLKLSRSAVYRYGAEFEEQFKSDMEEARRLYNFSKAALEANDDPEGVVREATIRTLQTRMLRLSIALREAEEAGDDIHLVADTTRKIARAVADLGKTDILSQKYKAEVRAKIAADLEALKKEGFDGATLDAVQQRVAVYLPANGR
jgi:hypothetical protein